MVITSFHFLDHPNEHRHLTRSLKRSVPKNLEKAVPLPATTTLSTPKLAAILLQATTRISANRLAVKNNYPPTNHPKLWLMTATI